MYEDLRVEVLYAGAQPHPNQNRIAVDNCCVLVMEYSYISLMEPKRFSMTFRNPFTITDDALMGSFKSHCGKKVTVH